MVISLRSRYGQESVTREHTILVTARSKWCSRYHREISRARTFITNPLFARPHTSWRTPYHPSPLVIRRPNKTFKTLFPTTGNGSRIHVANKEHKQLFFLEERVFFTIKNSHS
ncbi:hypothetical protein COOONC_00953 [Cooperia oncophora]